MTSNDGLADAVGDLIESRLCAVPGFVERTGAYEIARLGGKSVIRKGRAITGGVVFHAARYGAVVVHVERCSRAYRVILADPCVDDDYLDYRIGMSLDDLGDAVLHALDELSAMQNESRRE